MRSLHLWLYQKENVLLVYDSPTPSCDEVVFELEELDTKSCSQMDIECSSNVSDGHGSLMSRRDYVKSREWLIRHQLRGWNLDVPLTFEDGILDDESLQRAMSLHPAILSRILRFFNQDTLSEDERAMIAKQSMLLFGKAGSVENAHPLISLYVTLSDMWQKFGLNYFDLQRLPVDIRDGLKEIMRMEGQVRASEAKSETNVDSGVMKRLGMKG